MRLALSALAFLSFALLNTGCDLTQGMAGKMDQTNANMDATNAQIQQTNQTTDKMDNKMGSVVDASHDQELLTALNDMVSDQNTQVLVPVPFDMLKDGKKFAEQAHEDELMDWFYAEYKSLVEGTADDSQRVAVDVFLPKLDSSGHEVFQAQYSAQTIDKVPNMIPRISWEFPSSYLNSFNHQKDVLLNAMQVVAYFIPQDMIASIVADQINAGGMRIQTAYLILNLRDIFGREAMLGQSLYTDKLADLAELKEALRIVNDIDYIAHLPCVSEIEKTKIRGYLDISANYVYQQQALQSALANVVPVTNPANPFVPATVPFDPSREINSSGQVYYTLADDNMTVVPIDQSAARTSTITYDPNAYKQDWKDLKRHFQSDLSKTDQQSDEGQQYLTEINSHL
jgi:hypothetical protein